jgi:serine/threonine-protein kinase
LNIETNHAGALTGKQLGDLQLQRLIGSGGMAEVYQATQLTLGRTVAVKVLRPVFGDELTSRNYVERFQVEARAAARLNHPNIVQVYDVGQRDGQHYISQEFVDGLNLRQLIDRDGPLSFEDGVLVLSSVLTALEQAGAAGITHRDIKPENIMLSRFGEVKVADFGLARVSQPEFQANLTQVGLTVGTPLYMSPEQVQGREVDPRSDLYSLGVTMFHVMTGEPPFDGETPLAIAVKQLNDAPPSIASIRSQRIGKNDLPRWFCEILHQLMAKAPQDRFPSAAAALRSLRKHERRSRTEWLIRGAVMTACLLTGMVMMLSRSPPNVERLLRKDEVDVAKEVTVREQYFNALRIDSPEAWEAVWRYFPSASDPQNELYETQARLQLARCFSQRGRDQAAMEVVKVVANNPTARKIHRLLAEIRLYLAAKGLRRESEGERHLDDARNLASQLSEDEREMLNRIASPSGLISTDLLLRILPET